MNENLTGSTVEVVSDDIRDGITASSTRCPVARAAIRTFGTTDVLVDLTLIRVDQQHYKMPATVTAFIEKFDAGKPVSPMNFKLGNKF
jgi:hypothetical protein